MEIIGRSYTERGGDPRDGAVQPLAVARQCGHGLAPLGCGSAKSGRPPAVVSSAPTASSSFTPGARTVRAIAPTLITGRPGSAASSASSHGRHVSRIARDGGTSEPPGRFPGKHFATAVMWSRV